MASSPLVLPGVLFIGEDERQRLTAHTSPAAGWMSPKGILQWSTEISVVAREALTEKVRRETKAVLPEEQIPPAKYRWTVEAAKRSPLVAVSSKLTPKLVEQNVRVHTIGVDRTTSSFFYIAEGGGEDSITVSGDLVQAVAEALGDRADNAAIERMMDSLVDRLLRSLSKQRITELGVELAAALPRAANGGAGTQGVDLDQFERELSALVGSSEKYSRHLQQIADTITTASAHKVDVPLYVDARKVPHGPFELTVGDRRVALATYERWVMTGPFTEPAAAAAPTPATAKSEPRAATPKPAASKPKPTPTPAGAASPKVADAKPAASPAPAPAKVEAKPAASPAPAPAKAAALAAPIASAKASDRPPAPRPKIKSRPDLGEVVPPISAPSTDLPPVAPAAEKAPEAAPAAAVPAAEPASNEGAAPAKVMKQTLPLGAMFNANANADANAPKAEEKRGEPEARRMQQQMQKTLPLSAVYDPKVFEAAKAAADAVKAQEARAAAPAPAPAPVPAPIAAQPPPPYEQPKADLAPPKKSGFPVLVILLAGAIPIVLVLAAVVYRVWLSKK